MTKAIPKMEKKGHRRFLGVFVALLLPGSAHFFSGKRLQGVAWLVGLCLCCPLVALFSLAVPGTGMPFPALCMAVAWPLLFIIMLGQSYRCAPELRRGMLIAILLSSVSMSLLAKQAIYSFVRPFKIIGPSMTPTLPEGCRVLAQRPSVYRASIRRGDIVVVECSGIPAIQRYDFVASRIAGLPGERIRINPPYLLVNGKKVTSPEIFAEIASARNGYAGFLLAGSHEALLKKPSDEIVLGKDEYLVLGDNGKSSRDGRYLGPVPRKSIYGIVTRVY